ncbi:dTDP-4-dehydrorhamnose reductase [Thioalkalivibrio sp. ALJ1]|uniref:dTDP-4-dehydrorhamnose reductase n=1 Tax=Thioalkalivibrio sp. ALJ1 TaxID=1158144 RepID=UPI0005706C13|nr:dTDP-4-dehydrorhamnose reductase [Thioalkalivibrio sp. ALJ1]
MRILLFGAGGQVGCELRETLASLGSVRTLTRSEIDLTDVDALRQVIRAAQPDVIVNAAAYTAVDRAEEEPAEAEVVNAIAPGVMAKEADRQQSLMVHFSTDYVFDGCASRPYRETDVPRPLSVYGQTKQAGEEAVTSQNPRHLVLRTGWVVGVHGRNFVKTILRLAAERDELRVVNDQRGAPTSAALLAAVTSQLVNAWRSNVRGEFPYGLYHVATHGETTWFDLARRLVGYAQNHGASLRVARDRVVPVSSEEYPVLATRPSYSVLDTSRIQQTFGITPPAWDEEVDKIMARLL